LRERDLFCTVLHGRQPGDTTALGRRQHP
jgi:hypothetical protein